MKIYSKTFANSDLDQLDRDVETQFNIFSRSSEVEILSSSFFVVVLSGQPGGFVYFKSIEWKVS